MIEIANLAEVNDGLDRWLEACEQLANDAYRGFAARIYKYVLEGTPQWSGNLVATWRITVGLPASGYSDSPWKGTVGSLMVDTPPHSRSQPNEAAMHYARAIARDELAQVRLGAPIFISNTAPYAWEVEENRDSKGRAFLRVVNLPVEMVHAAADKFGAYEAVDAYALAREAL
jgi:hypothetical protein